MKKIKLLILALSSSLVLTACGGDSVSSSYDGGYTDNYGATYNSAAFASSKESSSLINTIFADVEEDAVESDAGGSSNSSATQDNQIQEQKLIRKVNMSIKVASSDDLQPSLDVLSSMAKSHGGYIQSNNLDLGSAYANANIVIRVPKDKADDFLGQVEENGFKILYRDDSSEDVTLKYTDTETAIRVRQIQKEKYMSYLEKAESIEEMMQIESNIDKVVAELETYESRMKALSNQVDYTTITIGIKCEAAIESETPWEKFKDRLGDIGSDILYNIADGIEVFFEIVIGALFTVPVLLFILFMGIKVVKLAIKGRDKSKEKKEKKQKKTKKTSEEVENTTEEIKDSNKIDSES